MAPNGSADSGPVEFSRQAIRGTPLEVKRSRQGAPAAAALAWITEPCELDAATAWSRGSGAMRAAARSARPLSCIRNSRERGPVFSAFVPSCVQRARFCTGPVYN